MPLELKQEDSNTGTAYDEAMLRRVMARAVELQTQEQGTFSVEDMERIGAEIGVDPKFVRLAHGQLATKPSRLGGLREYWRKHAGVMMGVWWSTGWALPVSLVMVLPRYDGGLAMTGFFITLALYIGGGILGSAAISVNTSAPSGEVEGTAAPTAGVSAE